MPGNTGGADYRLEHRQLQHDRDQFGDDLTPEPGNMVGPTKQGMDDLIAQDPERVLGHVQPTRSSASMHPSPRVRRDPAVSTRPTTTTASTTAATPS